MSVLSPDFSSVILGSGPNSSSTSYPKSKIKVLLLERISQAAVNIFVNEGFQVETIDKSTSEAVLIEKIGEVHAIGIRSKTNINKTVLQHAKKLLTIGCFCIGTDQTDLEAAAQNGTAVFNSPYANTRSVAELVLGEMIMLARQVIDRSTECHAGGWNKSSAGCVEVRGKTLAIIGYGHVGSQLSILAESIGMHVVFYDTLPKLPLGNAAALDSMEEAIRVADFLSLHVPAEASTVNLIGAKEIALLRKGAFLINASRGTVVDIPAAAAALRNGHLGGAAFDVYPDEPAAVGDKFHTELQGCPNTILTPHVGGSTEEAQVAIGKEVATKMVSYINTGVTLGAVNMPELSLPKSADAHRILNIHQNVPGVLKSINNNLADFNIVAQVLMTKGSVGYSIIDINATASKEVKQKIAAMPANIRTRILY